MPAAAARRVRVRTFRWRWRHPLRKDRGGRTDHASEVVVSRRPSSLQCIRLRELKNARASAACSCQPRAIRGGFPPIGKIARGNRSQTDLAASSSFHRCPAARRNHSSSASRHAPRCPCVRARKGSSRGALKQVLARNEALERGAQLGNRMFVDCAQLRWCSDRIVDAARGDEPWGGT